MPARPYCAWFWDTAHGIVGGENFIWVYNSGNWSQSSYPESPQFTNVFRQLQTGVLYAVGGGSHLWTTTDFGSTWQATTISSTNATDAYVAKDGSIKLVLGSGWSQNYFWGGGTFAQLDANSCIITWDDSSISNSISSDGGITWRSGPSSSYGAFGAYADMCRNTFFLKNEHNDIKYSTDSGKSWTFTVSAPPMGPGQQTDALDGQQGILFTQTNQGVWVTIDGGYSWKFLGGPKATWEDNHLFPFGPKANYLIAFLDSTVWRCIGATDSVRPRNPLLIRDTLIQNCDSAGIPITIQSMGPSITVHLHITGDSLDRMLPVDTTVRVGAKKNVVWFLIRSLIRSTHFKIHADVQAGCYTFPFDTTLFVELPKSLAVAVDTLNTAACDSTQFPIRINSKLCNSLRFDSAVIAESPSFLHFESFTYKQVSGGEQDDIRLSYAPHGTVETRTYHVHIYAHFTVSGDLFDTIISIPASSHPGGTIRLFAQSIVRLRSCDDARVPIVLHTPQCDLAQWDTVRIDVVNTIAQNEPLNKAFISQNALDTAWIDVKGGFSNNTIISVHARVRSIYAGKYFDTVFNIRLEIDPSPSDLLRITNNLFLSNCNGSVIPVGFRVPDCDSIEITTFDVAVPATVSYSIDHSTPLRLRQGSLDSIHIQFPKQNLNTTFGVQIHIAGHFLTSGANFDTIITIKTSFSSTLQLIALNQTIADTFPRCQGLDTVITLRNLGCDTIIVSSNVSSFLPGWSVTEPILPLTLPPDSSFLLRVHYVPQAPGSSSQFVQYKFDASGKSGLLSDQVRLDVTALPSPGNLELQSSSQGGTRSFCVGDTTLTDTLRNIGCDTLWLKNASISGDASFTLIDNIPQYLAKDSSYLLHIRFAPRTKTHDTATVTIQWDSAGNTLSSRDTLTGEGLPGTKWLAAKDGVAMRDFGMLHPCEWRDTTVTFVNPGCDTLIIDTATVSAQAWRLALQSYPIYLPPNGELTVPVHFVPDTAGAPSSISGTLRVLASNSDSAKEIDIPFVARMVYAEHDTLAFSRDVLRTSSTGSALIQTAVGAAGDHLTYRLLLTGDKDVRGTSLQSVSFSLTNDDDLLSLEDATGLHLDSTRAAGTPPATRTARYYTLSPIPSSDTISVLTYKVYLAGEETSPLHLGDIRFTNTLGLPNDCVLSIVTIDTGFTYINTCSDSIIRDMMVTGHVRIDRIVPNPAASEIRVTGSGLRGPWSAEVYDVMGRRVVVPTTTPQPPPISLRSQEGEIDLDVRGLPEGVYYLRVGQAAARFEIVR